MAITPDKLQDYPDTITSPKTDRRNLLKMGAVAGAGVVAVAAGAGGILKMTSEGKSAPAEAPKPTDYTITAAEAEAGINALNQGDVMPNLYADRPWADPELLLDLSERELKEFLTIPINADTRTDAGLARAIVPIVELIANAPYHIERVIEARAKGYPVGEKDSLGNELGNYSQFAATHLIGPMIEKAFPITYTDPELMGSDKKMTNHFAGYSDNYEAALTDASRRGTSTLLVDGELIPTQAVGESERSISVGLTTRRPAVDIDTVDDRDVVYEGYINVDVYELEESQEYRLGLHGIYLDRQ